MRLLVVEGNDRETWRARQAAGGVPYHQRFIALLNVLVPQAQVSVAFPADGDQGLPSLSELRGFDGVLWTGSALNVYHDVPAVTRQLSYADTVFQSGVPIYGSCWGLQIAVTVAGGRVAPSPNGREFAVASNIQLTQAGQDSGRFPHRRGAFESLCIHIDEVVDLPADSVILAENAHSPVQALSLRYKNSDFFGVQYHPEFTPGDVAFLNGYLKADLLREGHFASEADWRAYGQYLTAPSLPLSLRDARRHAQEISQWLGGL